MVPYSAPERGTRQGLPRAGGSGQGPHQSFADHAPLCSIRPPGFNPFGDHQEFLGADEEATADTANRIRSVWPLLVRKATAFQATLKPRERAAFDTEDTVAELWLTLAAKDGQWTPGRAKYVTFAGVIIDRALYAIRDRARTVHAPKNSLWRMRKYREEEAAGTLTDRRAKTAEDIQRTGRVSGSIGSRGATDEGGGFEPTTLDDPLAALAARERADGMRSGLRDAMRRLPAFEAEVVARLAGLGGVEPTPVRELALAVGRTEVEVRRAKERAVSKIRKHLTATRHPFFVERN